ncbi:DUF4386 domain-containing protein [bacterium]|nr:DUF4386 domain-containing protein [bacterium]
MRSNREKSTTIAGLLYLLAIIAGILSIAYAIDDPEYLIKASSSVTSVMIAAFFHFLMAPIYLGIAISLYPVLKKSNQWLAFGFIAFRIIASVFIIIGVIILLLLLTLSQEYVGAGTPDFPYYQTLGGLLQMGRDLTNHVATILAVSFGGLLFYILLLRGKLVPQWLSGWGLLGTMLTIVASYLVMFQLIKVISQAYIIMNIPMALQEIVLGVWLIVKGVNKKP